MTALEDGRLLTFARDKRFRRRLTNGERETVGFHGWANEGDRRFTGRVETGKWHGPLRLRRRRFPQLPPRCSWHLRSRMATSCQSPRFHFDDSHKRDHLVRHSSPLNRDVYMRRAVPSCGNVEPCSGHAPLSIQTRSRPGRAPP
jgi:hypothetical protein